MFLPTAYVKMVPTHYSTTTVRDEVATRRKEDGKRFIIDVVVRLSIILQLLLFFLI